jgi:hypothetical protein
VSLARKTAITKRCVPCKDFDKPCFRAAGYRGGTVDDLRAGGTRTIKKISQSVSRLQSRQFLVKQIPSQYKSADTATRPAVLDHLTSTYRNTLLDKPKTGLPSRRCAFRSERGLERRCWESCVDYVPMMRSMILSARVVQSYGSSSKPVIVSSAPVLKEEIMGIITEG